MTVQADRAAHPGEADWPAPGTPIEELDTPTILVDLDRLERNIADWQAWMDSHGVKFRVHVKTHKIPEIALLQLKAGARGIICAKPSEAEPFAAAGIDDICIAYPTVGEQKWRRLARMAGAGVRITANCDNPIPVSQASEAATAAGVTFHLQIDVDTGMHRGGIPVDDVAGVEALASLIEHTPGVELDGLTTHRSYFFAGKGSPREEGRREGELLVTLAEKLRGRGLELRELTAGGSFTGKGVAEAEGITESRAGTYVFYDLMHLSEGNASEEQLALTALCSVVSLRADDRVTIDGGSKTFSGDRGVVGAGNAMGTSSALAFSTDHRVTIESFTEEHGMALGDGAIGLGDKFRFYPFHACTCSNLTNEMVAFRDGRVEAVWRVAARGLRT